MAQNYQESNVPSYTVPDLLITENGEPIETVDTWENNRRDEILELFNTYMYGRVPEFSFHRSHEIRDITPAGEQGKISQQELVITLSNKVGKVKLNMLLTLPAHSTQPVPIFIGLNFHGNQATHNNPDITLTDNYVIANRELGVENNRIGEKSRGAKASRWPLDLIIEKGYGLATLHCGDIDPDFDDGFKNGVHSLLESQPNDDEWGTVAAWAWGLSRAVDHLVNDSRIDKNRIIVIGHSRLGKAALWAGANDDRFAMVISNNSGCGGAALSRRRFGETVEAINTNFPHWFCKNFHKYNGKENELPLDQHMLLALIAPRPVYIASAHKDQWADPKGEYTSLFLAGPTYKLYRIQVFESEQPPDLNHPLTIGKFGYHIREGEHDITKYDWEQYLKFADKHLR